MPLPMIAVNVVGFGTLIFFLCASWSMASASECSLFFSAMLAYVRSCVAVVLSREMIFVT